MLVKINELKEGCILSNDVFGRTNRPIVPKNTVITTEMIEFLHAFLIKDVEIKRTMVDGTSIIASEVLEEDVDKKEQGKSESEASFSDLFLQAAKAYKREFHSWQSGLPVDVSKVRQILLPLIEKSDSSSAELFQLHHYSTESEYLFQHSIAVGLISGFIGKKLQLSKGDIVQLAMAGCLADCGMAKIPPAILNKKEALTSSEFAEIKGHPTYSYKMIKDSSLIRDAGKIGIFQHHERLDGSGYPLGERDQKIHQFAKIIAVADTFHAMTSARLYRKKQSPFKVLEMIIQDNFGKFDIAAIKALQSGIMNFSIGSKVRLSNGQIAEILFIAEKSPTLPLVKIKDTEEIIHLEKSREIFIEEIL